MTRVIINENESIYIDGYRHILQYEPDKIVLKLSKRKMIIDGHDLNLTSFCNTEMLIKGEIINICFEKA